MTIEAQLKEYIIKNYRSIREFSITSEIAYSTLDNLFKRGVMKSGMSTIIKLCDHLNISVDALAKGSIVPLPLVPTRAEDEALALYKLLDTEDKAVIRGEIKQMLRADKYQSKSKHA